MKQPERQPDEQETRAAVALTVAWMLACMSTALGMLVVLGLRLLMIAFPGGGGGVHPLEGIAGVMLFVALSTGLLCLLFTPLAYRVRQIAPPRAIAVSAVLIGLSPIVMIIVVAIARR
jgi:hypothetical protein